MVYQVFALIALVTVVIKAFNYFQTPFIGSFVEHTLVMNSNDSVQPGTWEAKNKGLGFGHQILGIDDKEINSLQDLNATLHTYEVGDVIELKVIDLLVSDPQPFTETITLQAFPIADQITQMMIPLVIGLVFLASGLWVLSMRRYDTTGQVFSTFTASVAITAAGLFEIGTTGQLTGFWTFCLAMAGGTMVHLALLFPQEIGPIRRRPFLGWLSYLPTILLLIWAFPTLYNFNDPLAYVLPWRYEYIFVGFAVFFFVGMGIYHRYTAPSPIATTTKPNYFIGNHSFFYSDCDLVFYHCYATSGGIFFLFAVPFSVFPHIRCIRDFTIPLAQYRLYI